MRNRARCFPGLSRLAAITFAWRRAFSLGLLGAMLGSTPAEAKPFAYVTHFLSDTVSVIDTATNTVVATVLVGLRPAGVAITPDGTHAYVANSFSNTVSVIDTATNTVVATVPVGLSPGGVAITPDGTHAYVTNAGDHTVSVIDTATNTVVATVPLGLGAGAAGGGVAITPDGTHAYVTNGVSVSVIDTATNTVVATVPVGLNPQGVAITPDGTHAYVANNGTGGVSVIDTATDTVVASVLLGFQSGPSGVAITPDGAHAYVTTEFSNRVAVIATPTNTVVASVLLPGVVGEPTGVAITPDGAHAYVANIFSGTVSVIDTATDAVVATVPMGGSPFGVAITPTLACPLGQGFWKNHSDTWPVTSLTLGSQTYTQAELLALFDTPPSGDASVILAHQLIAAKLNIANGANAAPIRSAIADADALLGQFSSTLPYNVGTSSAIGQRMVHDATVLGQYNNGELTPDCRPQTVPEAVVRK